MLMCPVYACKSPAINAQLPRGGRPCLFFDLLLQLNCSALSLRHVSVRPRNIWTSSSNIPSGNLMLLAPGNGPLLHVFQLIVSRQCINERHFPPFKLHTAFLRTGEVSSTTWRAGSNLETTSPPPDVELRLLHRISQRSRVPKEQTQVRVEMLFVQHVSCASPLQSKHPTTRFHPRAVSRCRSTESGWQS